ncbi:hypothetical protein [Lapidilactobacillus gannanensis]|jgi:hypothetical protein|uniref:Uncharacterized protein n=1 Tax=Lapidilactobacillus gannanensis TaxID=2486002 RepID=A0ABW4BR55_9LACO|nr:hypothetical protein [Lapidilactobacillus gannanensis]MCH4057016.1 hypothetical protein [Lactobacillaceae bacterium]
MIKVKKVAMLPDLFIAVTYDNGEQRYFRSKSNEMVVNSLNGKAHNHLGLSQMTPGFYWIGEQPQVENDRYFTINGQRYDGDDIYVTGLKHLH